MEVSGIVESPDKPKRDAAALDKACLPKIKAKLAALNINESERAVLEPMLNLFFKSHNLHLLGIPYLNSWQKYRRGEGPEEIKRKIPCPYCGGERTMQLDEPIVIVFRRHLDKRDPSFALMMDSPKITRGWNEIDARGNNKVVHAEYRCCVRTHDCIDCNALYSYPDVRRATQAHFRVGQEIEKIARTFDAKVVRDERPQNF